MASRGLFERWITLSTGYDCPANSAVFFGNTYPLDKDLSGPACSEAGLRYPVDEC